MNGERGFTIVEVIVSVMMFTVGLTGLAMTGALTTRMIARGQRSASAAMFAAQRLEQLRATACTSQASGTDTLYRGGTWAAANFWSFSSSGPNTWRIQLTSRYKTTQGFARTELSETEVSCVF